MGALKQLLLDTEDQASVLRLCARMAAQKGRAKAPGSPQTASKGAASGKLLEEQLRESLGQKEGFKAQIVRLTKEVFKLNFKLEENGSAGR